MKNFALAGSVILTVVISIPLFGQWPSSFFLAGVSIVLLSVFIYSGGIVSMVNRRTILVWGIGVVFVGWDYWVERRARQLQLEAVDLVRLHAMRDSYS